jgi:disulfide bond formation protein DsbB
VTVVRDQDDPLVPPVVTLLFWMNVIALYLIVVVLASAFYFEFVRRELLCPLCLLQRAAFCAMGVGIMMNLKFGFSPRHYGVILLGACTGMIFAARQVLLHIVPGTGAYGSPVFGLHYYTWDVIVFGIAIALCASVLMFNRQFDQRHLRRLSFVPMLAIVLMLALTGANAVATLLECGFQVCPDPPRDFQLLPPTFSIQPGQPS